jgi:hypothetical protein
MFSQLSNTDVSKYSMLFGSCIDVIPLQRANASDCKNVTVSGILLIVIDLQYKKALNHIFSRLFGNCSNFILKQ